MDRELSHGNHFFPYVPADFLAVVELQRQTPPSGRYEISQGVARQRFSTLGPLGLNTLAKRILPDYPAD